MGGVGGVPFIIILKKSDLDSQCRKGFLSKPPTIHLHFTDI